MKTSLTTVKIIEQFEGFRAQSYQDTGGKWTIGYGHTNGVCEHQNINQTTAEYYLEEDLGFAETFVNARTSGSNLDQDQFDALVDFYFNTCAAGSEIWQLIYNKNFQAVHDFLQNHYITDTKGNRLGGLINRRAFESKYILL